MRRLVAAVGLLACAVALADGTRRTVQLTVRDAARDVVVTSVS